MVGAGQPKNLPQQYLKIYRDEINANGMTNVEYPNFEAKNMSDLQTNKIDYGNWVSKKSIYIPVLLAALLAVIFMGLSFLSLFFLVGAFLFLISPAYFVYAYFQFSPRGGNLQAKIRDLAFNQLVWDGDGRLASK